MMCDNYHNCKLGDSCPRAHNTVEDFYHPEKYKSKFCQTFPHHVHTCKFGEMCAFAHTEDELSIDYLHRMERDTDFYLFHFKTVWCPYSDKEDYNHPRDACVYAHNWQDFRRKVHIYNYSKDQCENWGTKKKTKTYFDGCPLEYRCGNCHGWKEQEYHWMNYKTTECRPPTGKCQKAHCPYFHNEAERRSHISTHFRLFPRNRGTTTP